MLSQYASFFFFSFFFCIAVIDQVRKYASFIFWHSCTRPTRWGECHSASSLKQQCTCVEMSLHVDTLSWFRVNQSLLLVLKAACLPEKQQILFVKSSRRGLEPMTYFTRGEHDYNYTTDAVATSNNYLWNLSNYMIRYWFLLFLKLH